MPESNNAAAPKDETAITTGMRHQFMDIPDVDDWEPHALCAFVGRQALSETDLAEIQWFIDVMNGRKGRYRVRSGDHSLQKGKVNLARWMRMVVKYPRLYENMRNCRAVHSEDLLETVYERVLEAIAGKDLREASLRDLMKGLDSAGKIVHRHDRRPVHIGDVIIADKAEVDKRRQVLVGDLVSAIKENPTVRVAMEPFLEAAEGAKIPDEAMDATD